MNGSSKKNKPNKKVENSCTLLKYVKLELSEKLTEWDLCKILKDLKEQEVKYELKRAGRPNDKIVTEFDKFIKLYDVIFNKQVLGDLKKLEEKA